MSNWDTVRPLIKAALQSVTGIGNVYESQQNPTDETTFRSIFIHAGSSKINTTIFSRKGPAGEEYESDESEDEKINWTDREERWRLELYYGFSGNTDINSASEKAFQELVDAIEDKFRFQQDLGGSVWLSEPLRLLFAGEFSMLGGKILCHKAEWELTLHYRIENTVTTP